MYRDRQSGSAASAETLSTDENSQGFDRDPQETGGFLIAEENPVTHIHGEVKIPGVDMPVEYKGSMPAQPTSRLLNLVVPGFGGIKGSYDRFADSMAANEGIFTVRFEPARSSSKRSDPQQVHADTIAAITQDLPNNEELAAAPNGLNIDFSSFTADLHSMGGIAGTKHALKYPEEMQALVYLNSVGLGKCTIPAEYLINLLPCAAREMLPAFVNGDFRDFRDIKTAMRIGRHLFSNVGHTVGEIITCHTAVLSEDIEKLGKLGVKRAVICGAKDNLVPANPSVEAVGDLVDHCEVVPELDHFGPQKQPAMTAALIGGIIRKYS